MEAYKLFVRKNREFVHSLESLANGITWLLPERFSNSEIGPEAVYALLGILSTLNQHIIDTTPTKLRPPSLGDSAFPWSLFVSMLKDAETVVEVAAEHFVGEKHKWNYLALTEAVKAFVRLAAFRDSGFKILLQGGEIVNNDERVSENYNTRLGDARMAGGSNMPGSIHERYGTIQQNLEGRAISALSCFGENAKKLSDQVWLNKLRHSSQTAGYSFFASLSVAKQTLSTLWFQKGLSGQLYLSGEMKRRKLVWALYIMRDPFFSKYTKHRLEKTDKYFSQVPLIGFLTGLCFCPSFVAQTRYTYTSAS
ncbi:hypothetical protein ZIOFF_038146 [Zingiber officinale]|uniref:Peroxisomal membrane protein PEX16 n=1 Tax=Zingiber officinale TaxID=94328 RepID=A0A8J5L9S3_ZINOF|nr:hypothetical protein ZIOFF_038146 [Zingiber officinale]